MIPILITGCLHIFNFKITYGRSVHTPTQKDGQRSTVNRQLDYYKQII